MSYDPEYIRKELRESFDQNSDAVAIKAKGCTGESKWVNVPAEIFRQMLAMVRPEGRDKALPVTFMGGEVVMAARIPYQKGRPRHRGVIVWEKREDGEHSYTVHYVNAQRIEDPWDGWQGEYELTMDEAFEEFARRLRSEKIIKGK